MADRFDEMAQEFCMEHNLAVDGALAALLRKVHDEAIEAAAAACVHRHSPFGEMVNVACGACRVAILKLKAGGK